MRISFEPNDPGLLSAKDAADEWHVFCNSQEFDRALTADTDEGFVRHLVTEELLGVSGGILMMRSRIETVYGAVVIARHKSDGTIELHMLDRATPEDAGEDLTLITRDIARGL